MEQTYSSKTLSFCPLGQATKKALVLYPLIKHTLKLLAFSYSDSTSIARNPTIWSQLKSPHSSKRRKQEWVK